MLHSPDFSGKHMRFWSTATLLHGFTIVVGQSISLPGSVIIQNSEYETGHRQYVSDASIRAPFAKPLTTGKDGQFALAFAGVESGTPVRLTVSKPGLEVVNNKETDQVILGRIPHLDVVMTDPEKLAEAQTKYYHIATESVTRNYERHMAALRAENVGLEKRLAALNTETGQQLKTLGDAIDLLTKQRADGMANAMDLAQQFAQVNLDDASALYRRAYEAFQRGQLDSVLLILSEERLEQEYRKLSDQKVGAERVLARSNEGIRQLFESHDLKAHVQEGQLKYAAALATLEKMLAISVEHPEAIDTEKRIGALAWTADLLNKNGDLPGSLAMCQQGLDEAGGGLPTGHLLLAQLYNSRGQVFDRQHRYDEAIADFERVIAVHAKSGRPDSCDMASAFSNIAVTLQWKGDFDGALSHARTGVRLTERDTTYEPDQRSTRYVNLGSVLLSIGRNDEAVDMIMRGIAIGRRLLDPNDPGLALEYCTYGGALLWSGRLSDAEAAYRKALEMMQLTLGTDHPSLVDAYQGIASVLGWRGEHAAAIEAYDRAMEIRLKATGPEDPVAAQMRALKGTDLCMAGRVPEALSELRIALSVQRRVLPENDPFTLVTIRELATAFSAMGRTDSAYHYGQQALDMARIRFEPGDGQLGNVLDMMAEIKRDAMDLEGAQAMYMDLLRNIEPSGSNGAQYTSAYLGLGIILNARGLPDSAIVYLNRSLELVRLQGDENALQNAMVPIAWSYAQQGQLDTAEAICRHALSVLGSGGGSRLAAALSARGWIHEARGEWADALNDYRTALPLYSSSRSRTCRTHYYLGRTLYRMGDMVAAAAELDSSYSIRPTCDAAWFRYKIAVEKKEDRIAFDHLLEFLRGDGWKFVALSSNGLIERKEGLDALRAMATKLGREDVLKEFNLE